VCGNGVVEHGEDCDDSAPGTPLGDGTPCGTGKICRQQVCSPAVCGDGFVTAPEECDDGSKNGTAGDGCSASCTWVCVSTDPKRNCTPADACAGQGACNDTTHVCTPGTPLKDGTPCGAGGDAGPSDAGAGDVCKSGKCMSAQCGDGIVEPPEQCDFGSGNGVGTGCEANCTFSCTLSPDSCVTQDLCAGANTCTAFTQGSSPGQKCVLGTPPPDGTTCANGGTCKNHVCTTTNCGNGTLDPGEQCDWGTANNVAGSGCNPDCTFSCTITPNSCPSPDPCAAQPQMCQSVAPPAGATGNGQKCVAGPVLAQGATCGGANICVSNVCKADTCGDGCVVAPEQCDPPNGTTCDANCQKIVCGDGKLGGAEQCDDGNTTNLDGCDQYCNFELEQRVTALKILGTTDTYCTVNALGHLALTATGLSQIQPSLDTGVSKGTINILFKFMGTGATPADLTGTTGAVTLGNLAGLPQDADGGAYSGNSDLDWWYTVDPGSIDSSRNPLSSLSGSYTNKTLPRPARSPRRPRCRTRPAPARRAPTRDDPGSPPSTS
jgi:cysteine-rich repeat protein